MTDGDVVASPLCMLTYDVGDPKLVQRTASRRRESRS